MKRVLTCSIAVCALSATVFGSSYVRLNRGVNAEAFAVSRGLSSWQILDRRGTTLIVRGLSADAFAWDPSVSVAYDLGAVRRVRHSFIPDDPFYPANSPAGWPGQWYLRDVSAADRDINVVNAWADGWTGDGVGVGVVDDGLERTHPDLITNYVASFSFDFGENEPDPEPFYGADNHGTSVAGLLAARGGNGIGMTGVAPSASLAGLRVDFERPTDAMFVAATLWRTDRVPIKNHSYGVVAPFTATPVTSDAFATAAKQGAINVMSAGNERRDANAIDDQNSPDVITVAAIDSSGRVASYSNFGANVFVTAPSSGGKAVMTTDRRAEEGYNTVAGDGDGDAFPNEDYTGTFGQTSASAPLVTGALALAKQANPNLSTRLAKHLLARSSRLIDATDATEQGDGWKMNGVGLTFNQNYGFGLLDATALVDAAQVHYGVTPRQIHSAHGHVDRAIPENNANGLVRRVRFDTMARVEEVLLDVDLTHTYVGDVEIHVTSPSGTTLRALASDLTFNVQDLQWQLTINGFWGERANGTWIVRVADVVGAIGGQTDTGTWNDFKLTLHTGSTTSYAGSNLLLRTSSGRVRSVALAEGRYAGVRQHPVVQPNWEVVGVRDLTADGVSDVVMYDPSTRQLTARRIDGEDFVEDRSVSLVPSDFRPVGLGDFDGDGDQDVALWNSTNRQFGYWEMDGATLVAWRELGQTAVGFVVMDVGDLDDDSDPDVLLSTVNFGLKSFGYQRNQGSSLSGYVDLGDLAQDFTVRGLADVRGDGRVAVLISNGREIGAFELRSDRLSSYLRLLTIPIGWNLEGGATL